MEDLGTKNVKLDTIKRPTGFAARKKEAHVKELAKSIGSTILQNLPVVRETTNGRELISGGDRLAALELNGVAMHEVRLVRCTDVEAERMTLEENLRRRRSDNYNQITKRLVELTAAEIATKEQAEAKVKAEFPVKVNGNSKAKAEPAKVGRPASTAAKARAEVAKKVGKSPEAVRAAENRAKAEEKAKAAPPKPPVEDDGVPAGFIEFGLKPDAEARAELAAMLKTRDVLDEIDTALKGAQRRLVALKAGDLLARTTHERVYSSVHTAADVNRRAMADAWCPYCKPNNIDGRKRRKDCTGCGGTGYVANEMLSGIAPELAAIGDKACVPDGKGGFVLLTGAPVVKAAKDGPAKGAKKITVSTEGAQEAAGDEAPAF